MNSAVIPAGGFGRYEYLPLSLDDMATWLRAGPFTSRVGYPETARFIERMTGVAVAISREATALAPGDEALVVRLRYRLGDAGLKGTTLDVADDDWEIGLLRCLKRN
jgi:hypothetical protein